MSAAFTPGPWSVPHFARDDHSCACGYVLSEWQQGMGAIATVHVSEEGADWQEGDHEPPTVAKANAHLIAAAPDLYEALSNAPLPSTMGTAAEHYQRFYGWLNGPVKAALAKASGQSVFEVGK